MCAIENVGRLAVEGLGFLKLTTLTRSMFLSRRSHRKKIWHGKLKTKTFLHWVPWMLKIDILSMRVTPASTRSTHLAEWIPLSPYRLRINRDKSYRCRRGAASSCTRRCQSRPWARQDCGQRARAAHPCRRLLVENAWQSRVSKVGDTCVDKSEGVTHTRTLPCTWVTKKVELVTSITWGLKNFLNLVNYILCQIIVPLEFFGPGL